MNEETTTKAPDYSGEEMKMPEGAVASTAKNETTVTNGPILVLLAIILLMVLGGLFYWYTTLTPVVAPTNTIERPTPEENNEPESTTAEAQTDTLGTVSTSDELSAIEADLESTNLESLDAELQAIDAELEASGGTQ